MDCDYWEEMLDWVRQRVLGEGMISPRDLDLVSLANDAGEAVRIVLEH
jgi:predicted Rossmann-fold nucleotide-binding protein